ncbi:uncharacterized protein TNCV_1988271 [Trichonephila clavipes]|nr:uncharacterized protein TNCV_1988271 [Trichonephila clavipes]
MTERLHISAQMCEVHWIQLIQDDGLMQGGPINWPARSPNLSCLDSFLWGHMKSLVYASPIDFDETLVARIAVVAGDIREMPGYLLMFDSTPAGGLRPASLLEVVVAAWSTTPSSMTPRSRITEICSDEREFQISPPEHNSVCAT